MPGRVEEIELVGGPFDGAILAVAGGKAAVEYVFTGAMLTRVLSDELVRRYGGVQCLYRFENQKGCRARFTFIKAERK